MIFINTQSQFHIYLPCFITHLEKSLHKLLIVKVINGAFN